MGVAPNHALAAPAVGTSVLRLHQRPLLLRLVVLIGAGRGSAPVLPLGRVAAGGGRHLHPLGPGRGVVDVHVAQAAAHAEEQAHELLLGEARVVDEVGVDHVLQVAAAVVREQHVDRLALLAAAALRGDAVVDAVDDAPAVPEKLVRLHLLHGLRYRLGPERASDLLERQQLRRRCVLYEVDV